MQITSGAPIMVMAPQTTGHPAALPADPNVATPDRQITPTSGGDDTSDANNGDRPKNLNTAPPSAIQIQIMEFLEQQAKEQGPADTL